MGQKWASDGNLVNIGQLDHYVVFGTKSGAVQDFQKGKKCHTGVKETLSGPPQTPHEPPYPPKTIIDRPHNQYSPSSYLITHQ